MTRLGAARRFFDGLRHRGATLLARRRYAVAALDQIALSVFNFGLTLCLVRTLSATDFGIVSLWMTVALFAIGIQNALVNTPLSVYLPGAGDERAKRRLEAALATVNVATLAATAAGIALVNLVTDAEWTPPDTITAVAVVAFVVTSLSREYWRSIAFARRDMGMLVLVDAPYLAITSACLALLLAWPQHFASLSIAFLMLSAGALVSQVFLRRARDPEGPRPFARGALDPYKPVAGEVGWSLTGVIATHLHARSYVYVTINMVGLASLAAINVVGVLFRPVRTMLTAWGRSALPQLAGCYASRDIAGADRLILSAFTAAGAASLAWTAALWLAWEPIARHFFVGKYPDAWLLLLPWAAAAGLQCVEYTLGIALQAAREFKYLAYVTLVSAPLTVAATAGVILWHDYTWAMYGTAFGNLVALVMEAARLHVIRRRMLGALPDAAGAPAE